MDRQVQNEELGENNHQLVVTLKHCFFRSGRTVGRSRENIG
jgi:hypothetical protein